MASGLDVAAIPAIHGFDVDLRSVVTPEAACFCAAAIW
jgi:hypothetical protein